MMSLRQYRIAAILLAAVLLLCGCGRTSKTSAPYLTDAERAALEQGITDSIQIYINENYPTSANVHFRNPSDYTLTDLYLRQDNQNIVLISQYYIPPHTDVASSIYSPNQGWDKILGTGEEQFYLSYTIGEYSYQSERFALDASDAQGEDIPPLAIRVDTSDGMIALNLDGETVFQIGNEIEGIEDARIYSMTGSVQYSETDHNFFNLSFDVEGKAPPEGQTLVYKLVDQNGIIIDSGSILSREDAEKLYVFESLEPGAYMLRFSIVR